MSIQDNDQLIIFTKVFDEEKWSNHQQESVSGTGSTLSNTETLRL